MKIIMTLLCLLTIFLSHTFCQPTGEVPLTPIELDKATKIIIKEDKKIDLPLSVDISEFMPEVGHQGDLPSCAAWATAYYFRSFYNNTQNGRLKLEPFSPAYIFRLYTHIINNGICDGFTTAYLLDSVIINGAVLYDVMPYDTDTCSSKPHDDLIDDAQRHAMKNYQTKFVKDNINDLRYLLSNERPIVASIKIDDNFRKLNKLKPIQNTFNFNFFTEHRENHAVVIVGYDDNKRAFKIINSWGPDWGDEGFGWIGYNIFYTIYNYGCIIKEYGDLGKGNVVFKPEKSLAAPEKSENSSYSDWVKKGYYRDYEEYNTRVVIKDVDKKNNLALIKLKTITPDSTGAPLTKELYLKEGECNEFTCGDQELSLTFEYIGKAGKNPIKKAVHYTLEFKNESKKSDDK